MKWIDSTDIRNWANRRDCQELLPLLVRKLIRATSNTIQNIKFPAGDSILLSGWDGILEVKNETDFLPIGTSLWEFGTSKDSKGKADDDYFKRTKNPLGYSPSDSTFIFVTPRLWQNEKDWIEEKKKDNVWKDVKVINSESLEEWIELAPTVGAWLAKYLGKYPSQGIQTTNDFWDEWSAGPKFKLTPEVILGGRESEQQKVIEVLNNPDVMGIQGTSREEALAFVIACVKNNKELEEDFFSRSIIIDDVETFRELVVHENPLVLIPRFEDSGVANRAVERGHTVIFPLGADATNNWSNKIVLPIIDRVSFIDAFSQIGISSVTAERYSRETARNITILRRQLEFERIKPSWARSENISDIIPILIIGRWDDSFDNDTKLVATIAGESYQNYIRRLSKWLDISDSPIVKIGNLWRLTSPLDAWSNASRYLDQKDFDLLYHSFKLILTEIDPALELPLEDRYMSSIYGKKRKYSSWIREGISQSLILISIYGERLHLNLSIKSDLWVDRIIAELLSENNIALWKSLDDKIQLIAEASPLAFLEALDRSLNRLDNLMSELFEEKTNLIFTQSYHLGLLRALESLAWFPQYLSRAVLILTRLSTIAPYRNRINRPINSLKEIFKSWHYQTYASFDERIQVLNLICRNNLEVGWELLQSMLPKSIGGIASFTHKTRWRIFDYEINYTWAETYETYSAIVEILINTFDNSDSKLAVLIEISADLPMNDRCNLLTFIENLVNVNPSEFKAWHKVRGLLSHHKSHLDSNWALSENELERYEKLCIRLEPSNNLQRIAWMFDDVQFSFPKGLARLDRRQYALDKRMEQLSKIYQENGLRKILEFKDVVNRTGILGDVAAYVVNDESDIIELCQLLNGKKSDLDFIQSFILKKSQLNDFKWISWLFEKINSLKFSNSALANLFVPLKQTKQLWSFIDATNDEIAYEYWIKMTPFFFSLDTDEKIFGLRKLIAVKRFLTAINISSDFKEEVPSEMLIEILQRAIIDKSDENINIDDDELSQLFEEINTRADIDLNNIAQLEWLYYSTLNSINVSYKPQWLYYFMATDADFFIGIFKWVYLPGDGDTSKLTQLREGLTNEQLVNRAKQAFMLLQSFKKEMSFKGVDYVTLKSWIEKVRKLATEYGRITTADSYIGEVLATYPEDKNGIWPPCEICGLVEELKSENVNNGFKVGAINRRGLYSVGTHDVDTIEASYYYKVASTHRNSYPMIATILEKIALYYEDKSKNNNHAMKRNQLEY